MDKYFACFSCFSKKITDKRRLTLKKPSANNSNNGTIITTTIATNAIEPHPNENIEPISSYSIHKNPFDYCSICRIPFDIVTDDDNNDNGSESKIDNIVSCHHCLSQICKSPQCGVWLAKHNHWECSNCHHFDSVVYVRAYDWIFEQLNRRFDDKATATLARVTKTTPINDTNPKSNDDVMLELNGNFFYWAQHEYFNFFWTYKN